MKKEFATKDYTQNQLKTMERQINFIFSCIDRGIDWNLEKVAKLQPLADSDTYFNKDLGRFTDGAKALSMLKTVIAYGAAAYIGKAAEKPQNINFSKSQAYTAKHQLDYINQTLQDSVIVMQDLQIIIEQAVLEFTSLEAEED